MRYWSRVVKRAFISTLEVYGLHSRIRAAVSIALVGTSFLALLLIPGGRGQLSEELRWAVALLIAAALWFVPTFGYQLLAVPAAIDHQQRSELEKLRGRGDEISRLIAELRGETVRLRDNTVEDYAYLLALEFAEDLASDGITPDRWRDEIYHGLTHGQLTNFLARLRILGIVDVRHRTIESDRGYPYQVQDYYLSDLGTRVVARLEAQFREMYPDEDD